MLRRIGFVAAFLTVASVVALADEGDPPDRVARLNYQSGSVSFRPGTVEDWVAATLNYPLTTGDHLWTDEGSQAEMHVGPNAVRMAPQTALSFLNLDDRTVQISLTEGAVHVHIAALGPDEIFEVDTPNAAIALSSPGEYRIDADADRNTTVATVRRGDAEVTAGGSSGSTFPVNSDESATISGMDTISQDIAAARPRDAFESWCEARDRREEQALSTRYVSPDMTGYEDLDANGTWTEAPDYGWVWAPRVEVGWAPYRFGHWAWVEPWGWTWIDDAPWGFAPFHYGRWAMYRGGWVWVPGVRVARPVYAPALVAFVGGPHFSVAVGIDGGGVAAWFPLGPHEVYRPVYHVSEVYVRQVNVTQVTNINVTEVRYVNRGVSGAVTAVPHDVFVSARPIPRSIVRVDAREVAQAQVIGAAPPIAPRRESVLASSVRAGAPPARFADRPVIARTAPPPPPVSFRARQQALEANQGRPLDARQLQSVRATAPPPRTMVRTVQPAPAMVSPRGNARGNDRPPVFQPRQRPVTQEPPEERRVEQPRYQPPQRSVQAPPRQIEQPRYERPQPPLQPPPRRVEQPRNERPQQMQQPPAQATPPSPRRMEEARPASPRGEGRGPRQERKAEKKEEKN